MDLFKRHCLKYGRQISYFIILVATQKFVLVMFTLHAKHAGLELIVHLDNLKIMPNASRISETTHNFHKYQTKQMILKLTRYAIRAELASILLVLTRRHFHGEGGKLGLCFLGC